MKCDVILNNASVTPGIMYLSQLLGENFHLEQKPHEQLYVVINVKQGTTVNLFDDLHTHLFLNTKVEFLVEQNASVTYEVKMLEGIETVLGSTPRNNYTDASIIAKELIVRLLGPQAHASLKGTCFGHERRIFKFKTLQDHQAPHATSNVIIKSVLDDESLFSCYSLINVIQEAQGTVANQANKNILLSNKARATSIPMLEVIANDVTCKHGAAVSTFDDEQLFYLQSRGMSSKMAKKLLVQGFLEY